MKHTTILACILLGIALPANGMKKRLSFEKVREEQQHTTYKLAYTGSKTHIEWIVAFNKGYTHAKLEETKQFFRNYIRGSVSVEDFKLFLSKNIIFLISTKTHPYKQFTLEEIISIVPDEPAETNIAIRLKHNHAIAYEYFGDDLRNHDKALCLLAHRGYSHRFFRHLDCRNNKLHVKDTLFVKIYVSKKRRGPRPRIRPRKCFLKLARFLRSLHPKR